MSIAAMLVYLTSTAQTTDSVKQETTQFIIDKFPSTRAVDLQVETFGTRHFDSKLFGENFQSGK